ncbi:MAG: ACT domain-containing protein [Lachnospiraceae bacterium]|nr:ACT domain-containing protein [Lachnospiraceae bacterium]
MAEKTKLYVLKDKAVPDVLLRVMEAKKLLDSGKCPSVQEATERVGISRSSFYKYKDDIFPYHENGRGKTINMVIQMEDEQGILSQVLSAIAVNGANILTIHQSVPINGFASLSISADVPTENMDLTQMVEAIESIDGILYAKILARE